MSNRFDTAIILDSTTYVEGDATTNSSGYIGFGIAGNGVASSGPRLSVGTGQPTISAPIGSLYMRTDSAQLYQNTDGSTTWTQIGSISTGSIELTDNSADAFEFIQGVTPYLRFVTTNGAERNRSDVSWDFGSTAGVAIDFDVADNLASALEFRAGASGLVMLSLDTTNGAEILASAAPTVSLTAAAGTQLLLADNLASGLTVGSAGALSMMGFVTLNAAELIFFGAAGGTRYNDGIPLRFGTPGTDVVFTPDGTDVNVSGTGALVLADDFELRLGTDEDGALEYVSASNAIQLRSNTVSAAGASPATAAITVSTGVRNTTDAAVGNGSGISTFTSGGTDCTNAGGTGGPTGAVQVGSGTASSTLGTSGDSGETLIFTGDSADGNSGNVRIQTGTAAGTRGVLDINVATIDLSTQGVSFTLRDNSNTAVSFAQGNTVYFGALTTDGAEQVVLAVPVAAASTIAPTLRTAACYSPRWQVVEDFRLRPQLVASIANSDASKLTALIGTNAANAGAVFRAGGGLTLTTAGALADQLCVRSQTTANQGGFIGTTWSTSDQIIYRSVIRIIDNTNVVVAAGLKLSLTAGATLFDNATDADQIYFGFATDARYAGVAGTNWGAIIRIGGVSANVDLGVVPSGLTFLTIAVDSSRLARFYLNGALVATSAAITAGVSLLPFLGVETIAAAGKQMGASYMAMEKVYA